MATIDPDGQLRQVHTGLSATVSLFSVELDEFARRIDCAPRQARDAERAARFHFERDRRRYLAARLALRIVLADMLGVSLDEISLGEDEHGKPCLVSPGPGLHFNVSHSDSVALIALSDAAPVGVDIEVTRGLDDADSLAADCLSPAELPEWRGMAATARNRRFLDLWTRKEALLKAIGLGLSVAPSSFSTGFGPQPATLRVQDRTVTVWSVDLGNPGHAAAIAQLHPKD